MNNKTLGIVLLGAGVAVGYYFIKSQKKLVAGLTPAQPAAAPASNAIRDSLIAMGIVNPTNPSPVNALPNGPLRTLAPNPYAPPLTLQPQIQVPLRA
jgi:hypothetical protein